jgi:hypothetical protein
MKIIPFLLLGLIVLPESIIPVHIFPIGKVVAHPIQMTHESETSTSVQHLKVDEKALECDACMYLANEINQTIIHNPKVTTIIIEDLEKICQVLPDTVQALCTNAAEQTAPLLLNHLGDFIATEGCSDLGVCHTSHAQHLKILNTTTS